jgi:PAS domain S-box-containing protein
MTVTPKPPPKRTATTPKRNATGNRKPSRATPSQLARRSRAPSENLARAEADLLSSSSNLEAVFEATQETVLLLNRAGFVFSANTAAAGRLGLTREELVGRCVYDFLPPDVVARRRAMSERVFASGTAVDFEDERYGRRLYHHLQPVVDPDGRVIRIAVFARDITEQRQREDALKASEAKYRALFENTRDGIFLTHPDGTIQDANPAACAMLGMSVEDIRGVGRSGIVQADDCLAAALQERHRAGRFAGELTYLRADGTPLPVELESVMLPEGEPPARAFNIFRDITARRQARFEQETAIAFLEMVNACADTRSLVEAAVTFFREKSACDAVGIRLKQGDDYPYYEVHGFPVGFVQAESSLCALGPDGAVQRDGDGVPVLECMCGIVISGHIDPSRPYFTPGGSFWTSSTAELLAASNDADPPARMRNRCLREGFQSIALIPLRHRGERLGLLQLDDQRCGRLTSAQVAFWERLAGHLSIALAKTRAEDALRAGEEQYRRIVETACEGIWAADVDNITTYVNRRMADMLGYAPEEMIGRPATDFLFPEDLASHHGQLNIRRHGVAGQYERRGRRKDGGEVWTIASATPLKDADGRYAGSFAMFTDITARKRAEESSRIFEKMASGALDPLCLIGRDYVYRGANESMLKRIARTREEVIGHHIAEILGAQAFETVLRPRLDASLRGEAVTFAEWLAYPGLGRRFMELSYAPYREPDGSISGVVALARDVTERKRTETILEARLRLSESAAGLALDTLLQNAIDEAERLTESRIGFVHLLDMDEHTFMQQSWSSRTRAVCGAESQGLHFHLDRSRVWADCLRERRPVIHNDYPALPHRKGQPAGHPAVTRELVVPILHNDRIVAVMGVGNKEQPYDLHDVAALSNLGNLLWDIVLRKKAEEQVALQALVLEQAQDRVTITDLTGRIRYVNRAQCEALNRRPDDLAGQPYHDLGYDPLGGISHQELIADTLRFGKWRGEVLHRNADGSENIVDCRTSLVRDVSGKAVAICGVGTDITARKEMESALRESESRYRLLVEQSPMAVMVVVDGMCRYANPAALTLIGVADLEQISHVPLVDMIAPEYRNAIARRMQAMTKGMANPPFEYEVIRRDGGGRVIVESTSIPILFSGKPAALAIGQDITARKQAEDKLQESALFLLEAHRIARMGGWKANPRTDFLEWTEGVHEIIETPKGYAPPLSEGLDFYLPDYIPILKDHIESCLATGEPFVTECEVETAKGNRIWTEVRGIKPVTEGERTYVIGTLQDITERKHAEIEKRDLERRMRDAREEERRRIAREVHDELGQGLTALKIDLAWLRGRLADGKPDLLSKMESMNRMVASTLETVQRVSSELRPGILDSLGLSAAVEWFVRDFETRTAIECFLALEPEEITLEPDLATDIFRILQEALTNVARHSQATWVRVHLQQKPAAVELRVIDNGVGISDDQAGRPDSLGLLGMRERLAATGGRLSIQGLPGEGTLIRATIPLKEKRP